MSDDKVIPLDTMYKEPMFERTIVQPDRVLEGAKEANWQQVVVLGITKEGEYAHYASCPTPDANYLIDILKQLNVGEEVAMMLDGDG